MAGWVCGGAADEGSAGEMACVGHGRGFSRSFTDALAPGRPFAPLGLCPVRHHVPGPRLDPGLGLTTPTQAPQIRPSTYRQVRDVGGRVVAGKGRGGGRGAIEPCTGAFFFLPSLHFAALAAPAQSATAKAPLFPDQSSGNRTFQPGA